MLDSQETALAFTLAELKLVGNPTKSGKEDRARYLPLVEDSLEVTMKEDCLFISWPSRPKKSHRSYVNYNAAWPVA